MSTPMKYRFIHAANISELEQKVDALSQEGYGFVQLQAYESHGDIGEGSGIRHYDNKYVAVMKLKDSPDRQFAGVVDVMEMPVDKVVGDMRFGTPLIEKALAGDWSIVESFSGKVQLMRKRKDSNIPYPTGDGDK